jgi:hypothetical protein
VVEKLHFLRMASQVLKIVAQLAQLTQPHTPGDAALNHLFSIRSEIEPGLRPQQCHDLVECLWRLGNRQFRGRMFDVSRPDICHESCRHFLDGQDKIRHPGGDCRFGHARILGGFRILHHRHAIAFLDGFEPERPVRSGPREDDADRLLLLVCRERAQEQINRSLQAPALNRTGDAKLAVDEGHVGIGRQDVNVIRPNRHLIRGFDHGHLRVTPNQFGHQTFMMRVEMRNEDECDAAIGRHGGKKTFERLESARGCTNTYGRNLNVSSLRHIVTLPRFGRGEFALCSGRFRRFRLARRLSGHRASPPNTGQYCNSTERESM